MSNCDEKFAEYFLGKNPDLSLHGPTAADERIVFRQGYIAGMERCLDVLNHDKVPAGGLVDRAIADCEKAGA